MLDGGPRSREQMIDQFMAENGQCLDEMVKPKQILFFGCDLIGSTAMKQKKRKIVDKTLGENTFRLIPDSAMWSNVISAMFNKCSELLSLYWSQSPKTFILSKIPVNFIQDSLLGPEPILWKTIGDEIVFRKHVTDFRQVAYTIAIWRSVVNEVQDLIRKETGLFNVGMKSSAWLAECPIQNRVIISVNREKVVKENTAEYMSPKEKLETLKNFAEKIDSSDVEIDFVGPAIDTGFRIAKLASQRRFTISIDVAYLLSVATQYKSDRLGELKIYYDGAKELSGVFGGLPYPIFWIDMYVQTNTIQSMSLEPVGNKSADAESLEDKLTKRDHVDKQSIQEFCEAFYGKANHFIDKPFIVDIEDINFPAPEWYEKALEESKRSYADMLHMFIET